MSLFNIQGTVQEVAEAIAVVLGVEVTIIDENYKRVAASGKYKELIGKRIPSNSVFEKVFKDKIPKFICESHGDTLCKNCAAENICTELATIGYPIINNGELLGVIGINAFKEEQKKKMVEDKDSLLAFLDKISGLLAVTSSYFETIQKMEIQSEEIKNIIDGSSHGIMCLDNDGNIKFSNKKARNLFNIIEENPLNQNLSHIVKDFNMDLTTRKQQEVKVTIDKKKASLIIKNNPVIFDNEKVSTIMEINKTADVVRDAYNLLEVSRLVSFDDIVGNSENITRVKDIARRVAKSDSTVLITGESGTGKELFARAIHSTSLRSCSPFIDINCASIPDNLLESELFGYEGGSFSGARKEGKMGKFELANGGTIFLDEIGDMPLHLQPKILRVLQERSFTKVGGKEPITVDIRIIAATHRNLEEMIINKEFRQDLYYRLNVIPICIPSLKEKKDDILLLGEHFLKKYCCKLETEHKEFSEELKEIFIAYPWPGNIRELENVIEYLINISKGSLITPEDLPPTMKRSLNHKTSKVLEMDIKYQLDQFEKNILVTMLETYGTDAEAKVLISEKLNINLSTLYRKLVKYKL
jgi:sigma-54 dependent transcriptional regulator, acetoin dehydrogenase operon transcriptional activator AcoR